MPTGKQGAWIGTVVIGYALGAVALATIFWLALELPGERTITLLILILGGLLGWIIGILLSPYSAEERGMFKDYSRAVATFLSGYVLAKIDRILEQAVSDKSMFSTLNGGRLLAFACTFALCLLFTWVARRYVHVEKP